MMIVDPDDAGLYGGGHAKRALDVVAPDCGAEREGRVVGERNRFGLVAERGDADNRTEHLFAKETHLRVDVGKHGGADVEAVAQCLW
jgi:hypothetical protein